MAAWEVVATAATAGALVAAAEEVAESAVAVTVSAGQVVDGMEGGEVTVMVAQEAVIVGAVVTAVVDVVAAGVPEAAHTATLEARWAGGATVVGERATVVAVRVVAESAEVATEVVVAEEDMGTAEAVRGAATAAVAVRVAADQVVVGGEAEVWVATMVAETRAAVVGWVAMRVGDGSLGGAVAVAVARVVEARVTAVMEVAEVARVAERWVVGATAAAEWEGAMMAVVAVEVVA